MRSPSSCGRSGERGLAPMGGHDVVAAHRCRVEDYDGFCDRAYVTSVPTAAAMTPEFSAGVT
jgi:hypothetical protein